MQQKIQQAIQLYQRGNQQQAEQICRSFLIDYPRQPDALLLMGLAEKDRGSVENMLNEPVKAEAYFIKALKIDPGYFQTRHNMEFQALLLPFNPTIFQQMRVSCSWFLVSAS